MQLCEVNLSIQRTEANFKRIGLELRTVATARARLELLERRWKTCEEIHLQLMLSTTSKIREETEYFTKNHFLRIEESYLNAHDFLVNQIQELSLDQNDCTNANQSFLQANAIFPVKLPQINLPQFSGNTIEWENFKDLFETLIIQNTSLTNVTRLHYLKLSLKGEAAKILRHVVITDSNFLSTWETLKQRYDDKRTLISMYI